jgi:hypothetical protein
LEDGTQAQILKKKIKKIEIVFKKMFYFWRGPSFFLKKNVLFVFDGVCTVGRKRRHKISKVLSTVSFSGKCTGALTFENLCAGGGRHAGAVLFARVHPSG